MREPQALVVGARWTVLETAEKAVKRDVTFKGATRLLASDRQCTYALATQARSTIAT